MQVLKVRAASMTPKPYDASLSYVFP